MDFGAVTLGIAMIFIVLLEIGFSLSLSIRNSSTFNSILSCLKPFYGSLFERKVTYSKYA